MYTLFWEFNETEKKLALNSFDNLESFRDLNFFSELGKLYFRHSFFIYKYRVRARK